MTQTLAYLQNLLAIPSPTGFTTEVMDYVQETLENLDYEVQ